MTLRKNKTKGERWADLEKTVQQGQMATRINQMLVQQIGNSVSTMARDFGELSGRQRDAQYRLLAIQELLGLKLEDINRRSEELQIRDFEEASAKEDAAQECTPTDVVAEDSVVTVTSKTEAGGGILRSRLAVAEIGLPGLKQDLLGKKVGDVVTAEVNGAKHSITILDVKKLPEKAQDVGTEQQEQPKLAVAPAGTDAPAN